MTAISKRNNIQYKRKKFEKETEEKKIIGVSDVSTNTYLYTKTKEFLQKFFYLKNIKIARYLLNIN